MLLGSRWNEMDSGILTDYARVFDIDEKILTFNGYIVLYQLSIVSAPPQAPHPSLCPASPQSPYSKCNKTLDDIGRMCSGTVPPKVLENRSRWKNFSAQRAEQMCLASI